MNTVVKILKEADSLLTPSTWIRGCMAMNKDGRRVSPTSNNASRFCASGAIKHTISKLDADSYRAYMRRTNLYLYMSKAIHAITGESLTAVSSWNDHKDTTFDVVKQVFARAIQLAEEEDNK